MRSVTRSATRRENPDWVALKRKRQRRPQSRRERDQAVVVGDVLGAYRRTDTAALPRAARIAQAASGGHSSDRSTRGLVTLSVLTVARKPQWSCSSVFPHVSERRTPPAPRPESPGSRKEAVPRSPLAQCTRAPCSHRTWAKNTMCPSVSRWIESVPAATNAENQAKQARGSSASWRRGTVRGLSRIGTET
jgi:hypothetical protein